MREIWQTLHNLTHSSLLRTSYHPHSTPHHPPRGPPPPQPLHHPTPPLDGGQDVFIPLRRPPLVISVEFSGRSLFVSAHLAILCEPAPERILILSVVTRRRLHALRDLQANLLPFNAAAHHPCQNSLAL